MINEIISQLISPLIILLLSLFLIKNYIRSITEPIVFIIFTQSFSLGLVFIQNNFNAYFFLILFNYIILISSFYIFYYSLLSNKKNTSKIAVNYVNVNQSFLNIKVFAIIASLLLIIFNLKHIYTTGAAIFSDNISEAKTTNFNDGGGIIRRLNWSLLYFVIMINFFIFYHLKVKLFKLLFFSLIILQILGGNKGALVSVIFLLSSMMVNKTFNDSLSYFNRKIKIYLPISIFFAIFILFLSSDTLEKAFDHFIIRLLYFGDVNIYLSDDNVINYFNNWGVKEFIDYLFNSFTGMIGLVSYNQPIGTIMVSIYNGGNLNFSANLGPNLPYYATGIIFFGTYGSFILSFLIGFFLAYIKFRCEEYNGNNIWGLFIFSYLYFMMYTLTQDPIAFFGRIFDSIILITPILIISIILTTIIKKPRRKHV